MLCFVYIVFGGISWNWLKCTLRVLEWSWKKDGLHFLTHEKMAPVNLYQNYKIYARSKEMVVVYCCIKELNRLWILSQCWRPKIWDTTLLNVVRDFKREIICRCIFFLINFLWSWKIIDDKPIITSSCLSYFFSLWMAGLFISSIKYEAPAGLYILWKRNSSCIGHFICSN